MTIEMVWGGLHKVISGGQTGADQGGLLGAWRSGVETGGTAPLCFKTQIGYNPLLEVFGLTCAGDYKSRTIQNVRDSDGTVIIAHDLNSHGTVLTRRACSAEKKPLLQLDVSDIVQLAVGRPETDSAAVMNEITQHAQALCDFVLKHQIQILNVAGNREIASNGQPIGTLVMTSIADWTVSLACELLDLSDSKLIRKKSFFEK